MHATSPAHLLPSRYLETQMPIMQFWRFQRIQRQILVFASGIVIWIDIQKNQYAKGTQRSSSWSVLKHKSGPKFSIIKKSHQCLKPLRDDTRHSNCPKGGGSSLMNRLFFNINESSKNNGSYLKLKSQITSTAKRLMAHEWQCVPAHITTPPAFSILLRSSLLFGLWSSDRGIAVRHNGK